MSKLLLEVIVTKEEIVSLSEKAFVSAVQKDVLDVYKNACADSRFMVNPAGILCEYVRKRAKDQPFYHSEYGYLHGAKIVLSSALDSLCKKHAGDKDWRLLYLGVQHLA
jgi:hypothetical protein